MKIKVVEPGLGVLALSYGRRSSICGAAQWECAASFPGHIWLVIHKTHHSAW